MKTAMLTAVIVIITPLTGFGGSSDFTDEQLRIIREMIEVEREAAKQEIYAELCKANPDNCTIVLLTSSENQGKVEDLQSTQSAVLNLPSTTLTPLFFGPLTNTTSDRAVASEEARFDIEGSTASSRASIQLGKRISEGGSNGKGSFKNISIEFSAPLNKNESVTNIATLDGLSNAFQGSFKLSQFKVHGRRSGHISDSDDFTPEFIALCKAAGIDALIDQCGADQETLDALASRGAKELFPRLQALFWDPTAWKSTFGVDATLGYEKFTFRQVEDLGKADTKEVPWSLGAYYGFIPPQSNVFVSLGLTFQQAYKTSENRTVCPKIGGLSYLECISANIGEPIGEKKHLAYIDARSQFQNVGFSLRLTHDFKNDETGVDLPIYILKDAKGNLNGGVRLGWTDTDDFSLGVFVGSTFKLFK